MKILFLTFYFEPDLCAGSFRNSSLFHKLLEQISEQDEIHVITTQPNRYSSYHVKASDEEVGNRYRINRLHIPKHKGGMKDQINSFSSYFFQTIKLVKNTKYDLVYASSSRLFTAVLGSYVARKNKCPLYLDIRDIFTDSIRDLVKSWSIFKHVPIYVFDIIERYAFKRANHINIVSEGFKEHFKKYPKPTYSFFTNGIDDTFIEDAKLCKTTEHKAPYVITYAGNIGMGQSLDLIIPEAAQRLGSDYKFLVIGDGGIKHRLEEKIDLLNLDNVELMKPVSRKELLEYYKKTDFFFLHLDASEQVALPSKLFEYGVYDKPIIAGLGGYAYRFAKENVQNCILFQPVDVDTMVTALTSYSYQLLKRTEFRFIRHFE